MYSSHLLKSDFALTIGKHTQMMKENSKGMKDLTVSKVRHISMKPSQCIHITTPYTNMFQNHYNAYDMFSAFFLSFQQKGKQCIILKRESCIMIEGR